MERNSRRAKAVEQTAAWRWLSLWHWVHRDEAGLWDDSPLPMPRSSRGYVQRPQTEAELEALRRSLVRGAPFGEASWQQRTANKLDLESTLRPRAGPWKTVPEPE